jgi:putative endonuclease
MHTRTYYVYIMASESGVLYTGITNNLHRRVAEHRSGHLPGFTRRYRVHKLVWWEHTHLVQSALAREKEVKAWSRAKRVALIEGQNPTWQDLAGDWAR